MPTSTTATFGFGWGNRQSAFGTTLYKGALGVGDQLDHTTPVDISGSGRYNIAKIATSGLTTMILTVAGGLVAAGENLHGEFGNGTSDSLSHTSFTSTGIGIVTDVSVGGYFDGAGGDVLALFTNGRVEGWGQNFSGQLGFGDTTERHTHTTTWNPASHGGLIITQVECGSNHCAILDGNGEVWTAGSNSNGQLGRGTLGVSDSSWGKATGLSGMVVTQISCGHETTLFVISDGTVWATGNGADNRLGQTIRLLTGSHTATPMQIPAVANCVEARQVGSVSWYRASTGQLFWNGAVGPTSAISVVGGFDAQSDFGFAFPQEAIPPIPGVTYAQLAYTSGWIDLFHNEGMMAIGSDGKVYTQGAGFYYGPGDTTQTDHHAFTDSTSLGAGITAATYGAALYWGVTANTVNYLQVATSAGQGTAFRWVPGDPAIPAGWELTAFNDSAWSAPVLAGLGTSAGLFPPVNDPSNVPPTQTWGDPLWTLATETDANALMLYRFHLTVPAGTLIRSSVINPPTFDGTFALTDHFLGDGGAGITSFVNGGGVSLGLVAGTFENLLVTGDNVIAIEVPTSYTSPVPIGNGRWASAMFQLAFKGDAVTGVTVISNVGRSTVQFVG